MKTSFLAFHFLLFFSLSLNPHLRAEAEPVATKIENVTVFVAGAQVERNGETDLPAGRTELIFKGISPNLDPQSIQVSGDGAFTILSVIHQMNYREEQSKRAEITNLEKERTQLLRQQKEMKGRLAVSQKEEKMLGKNQSIGGANTGVNTAELRLALDLQRERMTEIMLAQLELESGLATLDSTVQKINAQLAALNQEKEAATSEILVNVSAKAAAKAKFAITYYVRDAGWFATYDFRVQDVNSPIDIAFKANVFQHSGEDWEKVSLKLSNGNPTESGVMRELVPWYLGYGYGASAHQYPQGQKGSGGISQVSGKVVDGETGEPLIGANILVKGTTIGTVTDIGGKYSLQTPTAPSTLLFSYTGFIDLEIPINSNTINASLTTNSTSLSEVVVTGMGIKMPRIRLGQKKSRVQKNEYKPLQNTETYQPTTVNFEIELPYTIPSDGKTRTVDIKTENVPAKYQYFCAPKLDESAFLTAHITDWQELNLLDGEVNLFFEGAYLGRSLVDTRNVGDTLEVSLGQDKGIVVERKKIKDYSKRQFIGGDKTDSRAFEVLVKNNKRQPVNITIQDQLPISTQKDISVEDLKYDGAKRDEKTNLLTWNLELQPREERKLELRYSVKYPKKRTVVLE